MKQVKFIPNLELGNIEETVNNWLEDNKDVKIVTIETNFTPMPDYYAKREYWSVMITYEPKKKLGFSFINYETELNKGEDLEKLENALQKWRKSIGVETEDILRIGEAKVYLKTRTSTTWSTRDPQHKTKSTQCEMYEYLVTYLVEDTDG